jgi:hypothetical protein
MRLLCLLLALLVLGQCQAQQSYEDTSGVVEWTVKVKRTSYTTAIVKITGRIRKGYMIGAPAGDDGIWTRTNRPTTFYFSADSNWQANVQPMGGALIGGHDKYKRLEARTVSKVEKITTDSKRIDTVINGRRRQARYSDSTHYPKFRTVVDTTYEKEYSIQVRTSGTIEIVRSIELIPTELQKMQAAGQVLSGPTGYVESKKEKKRREKTNKRLVEEYVAKYPKSIDLRIDYQDAVYSRYVNIVIPFRGKKLRKWYHIQHFLKPF